MKTNQPITLPQLLRFRAKHTGPDSDGQFSYPLQEPILLGLLASRYVLDLIQRRIHSGSLWERDSLRFRLICEPATVELVGFTTVARRRGEGARRLPVFRISRGAHWADFALTHGSSTEPISPIDSNI